MATVRLETARVADMGVIGIASVLIRRAVHP